MACFSVTGTPLGSSLKRSTTAQPSSPLPIPASASHIDRAANQVPVFGGGVSLWR